MATVLIIGASRGIGFETVKAALHAGHSVRALARSAGRIPVDHPKLEKMVGDALQVPTVKRALTGVDVIIQSLGISAGPEIIFKPTQLFSMAMRVLVATMEEAQVTALRASGRATAAAVVGFFIAWRSIYLWGASMTTRMCRSASSAGASSTG